MKAIVTGGLGFIGSHLAERLVTDGHEVTIVDDRSTNVVDDIPGAYVIGESIARADVPHADIVYHLASPVGPLGVIAHKGRLAWEVVRDAHIVAGWAPRIVDVSTSEVYGSGHTDHESDVCTFRPAVSARKEYAVAKLAAETMLRNSGRQVTVVRPFNVAGPRQKPDGGFVLPRFIAQAQAGEPLTVYEPGTQRRAFTHVADIVDGIVRAGQGGYGRVFNLGNPYNVCTIEELAREVIAATGSGSPIRIVDPRDLHGPDFAEAPEKIPNPSDAMFHLGWTPTHDRATTIRDALGALVPA